MALRPDVKNAIIHTMKALLSFQTPEQMLQIGGPKEAMDHLISVAPNETERQHLIENREEAEKIMAGMLGLM